MKNACSLILAILLATPLAAQRGAGQGKIVVANRASGSISVIDVGTDAVTDYPLPAGGAMAEPMYVVGIANRVFVGDRANDRIIVLDDDDFGVQGTVPAGAGVFHMWSDRAGRQLWVVNDIDDTLTVIHPRTLAVITTVPIPADLVMAGGRPHDVVVDQDFAFVSIIGVDGPEDAVVQFSKETFLETGRASVGDDPHVSLTEANQNLFVPAQNADAVYVLNRQTMAPVDTLPAPGAHGAGMRRDGRVFYTTNLPGGGLDGLFTVDARNLSVLGATDTPFTIPHNIALSRNGRKIYVTHSGATADRVTVYTASPASPVPVYAGEIVTGTNPFGLAFVP